MVDAAAAVGGDVTIDDEDVISSLAKRSARSRLMRNFRSGQSGKTEFSVCLSIRLSVCLSGFSIYDFAKSFCLLSHGNLSSYLYLLLSRIGQ